jgi:hypothetical protein
MSTGVVARIFNMEEMQIDGGGHGAKILQGILNVDDTGSDSVLRLTHSRMRNRSEAD